MATSIQQFDPKVIAYNAARLAHDKMPKDGYSSVEHYHKTLQAAQNTAAGISETFMSASTATANFEIDEATINNSVRTGQQIMGGGMAGVLQLLMGTAGSLVFGLIKGIKTIAATLNDPNRQPGLAGFFKALPDQWQHQTQMEQLTAVAKKNGYNDVNKFIAEMTKPIDPQKTYNFVPDPATLDSLQALEIQNEAAQHLRAQQRQERLQGEMQKQIIGDALHTLDKDQNGKISQAEGAKEEVNIAAFMKLVESNPSLKKEVLGAIDSDKNGSISAAEINGAKIGDLQPLYVEATAPVTAASSKAP